MNFGSRSACFKCNFKKPEEAVPKVDKKEGDWDCPSCEFMNFASRTECFKCKTPRHAKVAQDASQECQICCESLASVIFNCNHMCCCPDCAEKVDTCPICREAITERRAVYWG